MKRFMFGKLDFRSSLKHWAEDYQKRSRRSNELLSLEPIDVILFMRKNNTFNLSSMTKEYELYRKLGEVPSIDYNAIAGMGIDEAVALLSFESYREMALNAIKKDSDLVQGTDAVKIWYYTGSEEYHDRIGPTGSIKDFNELYFYVAWYIERMNRNDVRDWLISETNKLIYMDKLDLDAATSSYIKLSEVCVPAYGLWEVFDALCKNYFKSMLPSQLEKYLRGLTIVNRVLAKSLNHEEIHHILENTDSSDISFRNAALILHSLGKLKIPVSDKVLNYVYTHASAQNLDDLILALEAMIALHVPYDDILEDIKAKLDNGVSRNTAVNLYRVLCNSKIQWEEGKTLLSKVIEENALNYTVVELKHVLYCCMWLPGQIYENIQNRLASLAFKLNYQQLQDTLAIIGKLSNENFELSPILNAALAKQAIALRPHLESLGIASFAHHFAYVFNEESALSMLDDYIVKNDEGTIAADSVSASTRFFLKRENYIILNNQVLNQMNMQSLVVFCVSMLNSPSHTIEFKTILMNYLECLLSMKFWELNDKHLISIFHLLSLPFNFDARFLDYIYAIQSSLPQQEDIAVRGNTTYNSGLRNYQKLGIFFNKTKVGV